MNESLSPLFISGTFTLVIYSLALALTAFSLKGQFNSAGRLNLLTLTAILCHGLFLYQAIDGQLGQNLNLFNMLGMSLWLASIILLMNSLRRNVHFISLMIGILILIVTAVSLNTSYSVVLTLTGEWPSLIHIFAAMTATGFLLLATIQSGLVFFADKKLRTHPTSYPIYLPPLQAIESFLFQLVLFGFLLMSVSVVVALFYLQNQWASQPLHKTILTVCAWMTYLTLLIGHWRLGWRGVIAAKWTVFGSVFLILGYFGSKLVIELIL